MTSTGWRLLTVVAVVVGVGVAAPSAAHADGVDPATLELTLAPGQSAAAAVHVTTPQVPPRPDIMILGDTTGSLDPVVANVRNNIDALIDHVRASQPTARFGVAGYKEQVNSDKVFTVYTPLTDDANAVRAGADNMAHDVFGGGAPWTDFINAHFRLATDAVSWRPNSSRIILWFGDAVSHDPSLGHTLADTNNALQASGARVVAVPVVGTSGNGLDALGQATSVVNATGGRLMPNSTADQVADALMAGLDNLDVSVRPQATCDTGLTVGFDTASRTVRSGTVADFAVTTRVAAGTAPGTYHCTIDYAINNITGVATQPVTVTVPGAAGPTLTVNDVTLAEGNTGTTPATFSVAIDQPATTTVTVHAATTDGTAPSPADFTGTSLDLTFQPGETSKQVSVPVVGDTIDEPDETFTLALSAASGATIADGQGVATILDDDEPIARPRLSVGDVSVPEGDSGTTTQASFTVTMDKAAGSPVNVHAATSDGTATSPDDFTATSVDLTFAPGETSKTVAVPVVGDLVEEPDETFTLHLSAASGADINDADGVATIRDDDGSMPQLRVSDVSVVEGDQGTTIAEFLITADRSPQTNITGRATTAGGTATSPDDFAAADVDFTIPPGQVSVPVQVRVVGDMVDEPDETFALALTGVRNAVVVDSQGVGTIVDDDTAALPQLSIGDVTVAEGNSGTTAADFTLTLDRTSTTPVSVHYAAASGTATAGSDFAPASGDIVFAPGQTVQHATISVLGDTSDEPDETFAVQLSAPSGGVVADGQGVGTIVDDDEPVVVPAVSVHDATAAEGDPVAFTVVLDRTTTVPVSVHYATANGTATTGSDYTAASGDLLFLPGQATQQVTVGGVEDSTDEADETFTIQLSAPTAATIADGTATGTIVDDDRNGRFACRASAANLLGNEPAVANPAGAPCAEAARTVATTALGTPILGVRLGGATVRTDQTPDDLAVPPVEGDNATAAANLASARITALGVTIELGAITSQATARCVTTSTGLKPAYTARSTITSLRVNGIIIPVGTGPVTVPLLIGTLKLNTTTTTPTTITQRAVQLHTALGDITLGETHAGIQGTPAHPTGNPCVTH
ncbi:Calx-beta domain-containing protein [Kribbella sp. C-35]|uniref:Calx-beta domain-containing protein n=1 Tax=Kribbella sp. C-35 TaxID=2789276 RepID=UPI003979D3C7